MNIIPQPKKLKKTGGFVCLKGFRIVITSECDNRIFRAALKLRDEIYDETGLELSVTRALGNPDPAKKILISAGKKKTEGYTLSASSDSIAIKGDSLAGAFYGIQTLRQIVESCGELIPCCEIKDAPDMSYRGFYHDASRGRVPTVEGCKKMIDFLAYYKHNSYQLYIEHTFDFDEYKGIYKAYGYLTAEEIIEIDDYCYENFIDFVPSLSTFGHLFRLLESDKYKHLCELDSYTAYKNPWVNTMLHHTINASDPDSIKLICSLIDQYVPLFRSKYFNICCDETFDICNGKNAGKDKGELYLEFTLKIIDHLKSLGKTVMMWGDVVLNHPETMSRFPDDMVMLNWNYANEPPVENVAKFAEQRFSQIVCPGTACWNQFVEVVGYAEQNISKMVSAGVKSKVMGMLNTSWGDYGALCPMTCTLYGCVLGAALAWNGKTPAMTSAFDLQVSESVYGDPSGEVVRLIRQVGDCENILSWGIFINAYFDNRMYYIDEETPLPADSRPYRDNALRAFKLADEFRALPVQSDIISDLCLMTEGLGIVNLKFADLIDKTNSVDPAQVELWCEKYVEAWTRDDKLSEVDYICAVMRGKTFTI